MTDLEAVVETAGLERFALFGISQGCSTSIAYSVRHPERVTKRYPDFRTSRTRACARGPTKEAIVDLRSAVPLTLPA